MISRPLLKILSVFFVFSQVLLLSGCQPKVYLMPSPIGLKPGTPFYDRTENNKDDNRLTTFYATNRIPKTFSLTNDGYTILPSDDLRIGFVTHSVGDDESWESFYEKSLDRERKDNLLITMRQVNELSMLEDNQPIEGAMSGHQKVIEQFSDILEKTADSDITIYVHGANTNFYRATCPRCAILPLYRSKLADTDLLLALGREYA